MQLTCLKLEGVTCDMIQTPMDHTMRNKLALSPKTKLCVIQNLCMDAIISAGRFVITWLLVNICQAGDRDLFDIHKQSITRQPYISSRESVHHLKAYKRDSPIKNREYWTFESKLQSKNYHDRSTETYWYHVTKSRKNLKD